MVYQEAPILYKLKIFNTDEIVIHDDTGAKYFGTLVIMRIL